MSLLSQISYLASVSENRYGVFPQTRYTQNDLEMRPSYLWLWCDSRVNVP